MEDDLKILKVEYLSNCLLDHTQILNFRLMRPKQGVYFKWRQPPIEEDLKILKVECLSNQLLDPIQISKLSLDDRTMLNKFFKWRKNSKLEYLSNHDLWDLRGELEENS
jgi:hypothetical protein